MMRCIDLTYPGQTRDRRAARTAFLANVTGQVEVARQLLPLRPGAHSYVPPGGRLDETDGYIVASRAHWLVNHDVDIDEAFGVLSGALRGTQNVSDRCIAAVIPQSSDQVGHRKRRGSRGGQPPAFDGEDYRGRNVVERGFEVFKPWRGLATRYDKLPLTYRGEAVLMAITIWSKVLGDTR